MVNFLDNFSQLNVKKLENIDKYSREWFHERKTGCCVQCEYYRAYLMGRDDSSTDDSICSYEECVCKLKGILCTHDDEDLEGLGCDNIGIDLYE